MTRSLLFSTILLLSALWTALAGPDTGPSPDTGAVTSPAAGSPWVTAPDTASRYLSREDGIELSEVATLYPSARDEVARRAEARRAADTANLDVLAAERLPPSARAGSPPVDPP